MHTSAYAREWPLPCRIRSRPVALPVRRMAAGNPRRVRRIQAELERLGIKVSPATVSRYLPKREPDHEQRQPWMTFLRNHLDVLSAMDFLVVPTVRFKLLHVWFVIGTVRGDLLDHVVVIDEEHLLRLLVEYVGYQDRERIQRSSGKRRHVSWTASKPARSAVCAISETARSLTNSRPLAT